MINNFKTPALYNFLEYLKNIFPNKINIINSYWNKFSEIDLNYHNSIMSSETFLQCLDLVTNENIFIEWNIDSIIQYVSSQKPHLSTIFVNDVLNNPNYILKNLKKTLEQVVENKNISYKHKTNYIIIAEFPLFSGAAIIDGNHRFCEAIINGESDIKAFFLPFYLVPQFLLPNSRDFCYLFTQLNERLL